MPRRRCCCLPSPVGWLRQNHLVFDLVDLEAELDLTEIHAYYHQKDPRVEQAYDPKRMVVLLFYAYDVGLPSSHKTQKAYWKDAAFWC